jgi:hypothetical protein
VSLRAFRFAVLSSIVLCAPRALAQGAPANEPSAPPAPANPDNAAAITPPRLVHAEPAVIPDGEPLSEPVPVTLALTIDETGHVAEATVLAHFVDHDPARALAGWDAYLGAAPSGPFAPEARYNRALSLIRLGRNAEARTALEPFANGSYGGYRKDEASALLERIGE